MAQILQTRALHHRRGSPGNPFGVLSTRFQNPSYLDSMLPKGVITLGGKLPPNR